MWNDNTPCTIIVLRADSSFKNWRNLPSSNPKQIFAISIHLQSLVKIHWYLLKLSSWNENMDGRMTDRRTDTRTSNMKLSPRQFRVPGYKKYIEFQTQTENQFTCFVQSNMKKIQRTRKNPNTEYTMKFYPSFHK